MCHVRTWMGFRRFISSHNIRVGSVIHIINKSRGVILVIILSSVVSIKFSSLSMNKFGSTVRPESEQDNCPKRRT